ARRKIGRAKVGPCQEMQAGTEGPVFLVRDLSTVWLVAFVRESEAPRVKVGQAVKFTVLAYPDRIFEARINYVAAAIDPNSRRRLVRATIDNSQALLNPVVFANVTIVTVAGGGPTVAVPREAVIHEGDIARVWVAVDEQALELRQIKQGLSDGRLIQVLDGLRPSERVVTRGSLFIDRIASES